MNTALAVSNFADLDDVQRAAKMMLASGYFEAQRDPAVGVAQLAVKILAGREMGYGPFASVQGIHVIQGKPALSANLMAAAVKANPRYDYRVRKMEASECSLEFFQLYDGKRESLGVSTFTLADATKAGVKNLDKFPRNMLFARAMSNGVRWFCPDVFSGNTVYVPDELGAMVDGETGEIIDAEPQPATQGKATPAPQRQAQPVTEVTEVDNPFEDDSVGHNAISQTEPITAGQLKALHGYGMKAYGSAAAWKAKRAELVERVTAGASKSSKFLSRSEADRLIDGLKKKIGGELSDDELTELAEIAGYAPTAAELQSVPEVAH